MLFVTGHTHVVVKYPRRPTIAQRLAAEEPKDEVIEIKPERVGLTPTKVCPVCDGDGRWSLGIPCPYCLLRPDGSPSGRVPLDFEPPWCRGCGSPMDVDDDGEIVWCADCAGQRWGWERGV